MKYSSPLIPAQPGANDFPAKDLFASASTAVLVAERISGHVVAVNPAAQGLLGLAPADLMGQSWCRCFESADAQPLQAAALQAFTFGSVVRLAVTAAGSREALVAAVSSFFVSKESYLLVQLTGAHDSERLSRVHSSDLFEQLDALQMSFVVTDGALSVQFANRAFMELTGEPSLDVVQGRNLLSWLDLTQEDLVLMCRQMQLRQAVALTTTNLSARYGRGPSVEVTAISVPSAESPFWGFVLRQLTPHPRDQRHGQWRS